MIDDLGEVAQLTAEFISSLDNLPQEVQHIVKEIEHKDAKVQEMLPKLAAREAQLREIMSKKDILTDFDKAKIEKLAEKIKVDYTRADEWSGQKETLSKSLWRSVFAHQRRLNQEIDKISPELIKQVESTLPANASLPSASIGGVALPVSLSGLPTILANLKSPSVEAEPLGAAYGGSLKRKYNTSSHLSRESPSHSTKQSRQASSDRMASPLQSIAVGASGSNASNAFIPPSSHSMVSKKAIKSSGLSSMLAKVPPSSDLDADADADGEGEGGGDSEKDNKIYCHCQRVSFGEMIGCDSDDCPFEWFHLSCVGLSKPLPQTWYCEDCRERLEREKSEKPAKKRKQRI